VTPSHSWSAPLPCAPIGNQFATHGNGYIVVHELCHLREPSHQKRFWRLLETARPGLQEQARWLREHGHELHDYDPGSSATDVVRRHVSPGARVARADPIPKPF
jgi:hypothetical protein